MTERQKGPFYTSYVAQSVRGRPVQTFDTEISARRFVQDRANRGVRLQLVRVTTTQEVVQ